uniref:Transmembrane protein n=1 Tax=Noccaea caerulescens TaxID=107243 RepID=A0A1J3GRH5_NOCCA
MFVSDMERKTLATTPPLLLSSFLFHLRGAAFGSSKTFHCLLLLSCLLLSSVNTLHNLAEYDSCGGSNGYNTAASKGFQSFDDGDSESVAIQNVCPTSQLFSFLSALRSENQFDPVVPFFGLSCPTKSWSTNSALISNNLSGVVWLSLKPVHIIEFQPFTGIFHIGATTTPLAKELGISVSGKQCGRNGFMEQNQYEGFSVETGDYIKFLFFYQTGLSWASGVAVFAVPMKATAPVLMLNLCKKPVFWMRTKKFSIAVLVAAALLILIFCFNDHFMDENSKRNNCSNIEVRKVEKKPSTITISPQMDSLLRSISKETLKGSNNEVSENSIKPIASVTSSSSSSQAETSEAASLSVKTAKDKKRRRNKKKKKGAISGLTSEHTDVSSSHSGNSTPRSPMSPEPPATQATRKPVKPVLSHSATFPVSGVKSMIIQGSSLAPNVRAPGAKSRTEVKEEKEKEHRYDIWGDHLTGLHLLDRFKEVREGKSLSGFGEVNESESFFVKGPQNLLADSHASFVSSCNQWG